MIILIHTIMLFIILLATFILSFTALFYIFKKCCEESNLITAIICQIVAIAVAIITLLLILIAKGVI